MNYTSVLGMDACNVQVPQPQICTTSQGTRARRLPPQWGCWMETLFGRVQSDVWYCCFFEWAGIVVNDVGNLYRHSTLKDDLPASVAVDESSAEAETSFIRAWRQHLPCIKLPPYHLGHAISSHYLWSGCCMCMGRYLVHPNQSSAPIVLCLTIEDRYLQSHELCSMGTV